MPQRSAAKHTYYAATVVGEVHKLKLKHKHKTCCLILCRKSAETLFAATCENCKSCLKLAKYVPQMISSTFIAKSIERDEDTRSLYLSPSLPAWESLLQFNFPLATIKARSLTCCTRVSLCVFTSGIAGSTQAKKRKKRKEEQRNKGNTDKQIQNKQTSSRLPKKARQAKKKKKGRNAGSTNAYEAEIKTLSSERGPNKAAKFVNKHMSNSRSPSPSECACVSACV